MQVLCIKQIIAFFGNTIQGIVIAISSTVKWNKKRRTE